MIRHTPPSNGGESRRRWYWRDAANIHGFEISTFFDDDGAVVSYLMNPEGSIGLTAVFWIACGVVPYDNVVSRGVDMVAPGLVFPDVVSLDLLLLAFSNISPIDLDRNG